MFYEGQASNFSSPVILPTPLKLTLNQPKNKNKKITIYLTKKNLGDSYLANTHKVKISTLKTIKCWEAQIFKQVYADAATKIH